MLTKQPDLSEQTVVVRLSALISFVTEQFRDDVVHSVVVSARLRERQGHGVIVQIRRLS
jgi:hypothetical protein